MSFDSGLERLTGLTRSLVNASMKNANDGTALFVTNSVGKSDALWTRDFGYLMESCPELLGMDRVQSCIEYIIRAARLDGMIPDCVGTDGEAVYAAGVNGAPAGMAALDCAAFLTLAVCGFLERLPGAKAKGLFAAWEPILMRALCSVPISVKGLVLNDARRPDLPYGYAGGALKTGQLFMESLLLWRAMRRLEALGDRMDLFHTDCFVLHRRAEMIERNIYVLFEERVGVFLAADGFCRQPDLWGMFYLLDTGFPLQKEVKRAVSRWLLENRERCVCRGRISHLPDGNPWERCFPSGAQTTARTGAYWALPSGWAMRFYSGTDRAFAEQMLRELLEDFEKNGVWACTDDGYAAGEGSLVSAAGVLYGVRRIVEDRTMS